jgi:hypothetical protein
MLCIFPHLAGGIRMILLSWPYLCMKRAMAPAQRENTMRRMTTSPGLTRLPLLGMGRVQLYGTGATATDRK